jgi:hypothetical protein
MVEARTNSSNVRSEPLCKGAKQGQYLAFIYAYTRLHRLPPAETDSQPTFSSPNGADDKTVSLHQTTTRCRS